MHKPAETKANLKLASGVAALPEGDFLEALSEPVMQLDCQWRITYLNSAAAELFSRSRDTLIQSDFWQSLPQTLGSPIFAAFQRALNQNTHVQVEDYFPRQDRWYAFDVTPNQQGLFIHGRDMTTSRKTRHQEEQRVRHESQLLAAVSHGVLGLSRHGQITYANPAAGELFGCAAPLLIGQTIHNCLIADAYAPDTAGSLMCTISQARHLTSPTPLTLRRADGTPQPVIITFNPLPLGEGATGGVMLLSCRRPQIQMNDLLERSRGFLRSVLDTLPTHLCILDHNGTIIDVNQAWRSFATENQCPDPTGGLGTNYLMLCQGVQGEALPQAREVAQQLSELLKGCRADFEIEYPCHAPNEQRWFLMRVTRFERDGQVYAVVVHHNITQRKLAEMRSLHDSMHDSLTGLPNRVLFQQRLKKRLEQAQKTNDYQFAVLFLDLDHFKNVNDSLGHSIGDKMLQHAAGELQIKLRVLLQEQELSSDSFVVARQGGDEFMVLFEEMPSLAIMRNLLSRLHPDDGLHFKIDDHDVFTSASMGVVFGDPRYTDTEALVRDADTAMYRAKANGRGRYEFFDQAMHVQAAQRMLLEQDLRRAIDSQQFELHYQPIFELESGKVLALEALVRWSRGDGSYVSPNDFIPLAEETDLIVPLGKWVVEEACRQLGQWCKTHPEAAELAMHVNLSQRQLCAQDNLVQFVRQAIVDGGIRPAQLHLEITESAIMTNPELAGVQLQSLRAIGVKVDIDDFGTGYSSLSYLHRLPLDGLKIDRAFVGNLARRRDYPAVVQAIVALAHNLNMHVVAEGIETRNQLVQLQTLECDAGQGYFFAKPLTVAGVRELFTQKISKVA